MMGLLSSIFDFLAEQSADNYMICSERWFDYLRKHFDYSDCAEGVLEVRNGKLFKKFVVRFRNNTKVIIMDDEDEGCSLSSINLNSIQKKQILKYGYFILKEYE